MKKPGWTTALVVALGLLVAACTSGDDDDDVGTSPTSAEQDAGELGPGVTEDSVKVAYTWVDTDAVAESVGIETYHGPYEDIMEALVDDLNDQGGINGRTVELIQTPFNPTSEESILASCTKATEDEQVFAVLGGGFADLCVVEQHETVLVGGSQSAESLERARAPWATFAPGTETAVQALVQAIDDRGGFDGRTVAIYGRTADQVSIDAAKEALADADVEVAFEAINDVTGVDRAAIDAQDITLGQRMSDEGVDAVFIVGGNVPAAVWSEGGFEPRLWISDNSTMGVFAGESDLSRLPEVLAVGLAPPNTVWESEPMQECIRIYEEATGDVAVSPQEALDTDEKSPFQAMQDARNTFIIFREAAAAAGDTLNNDTFLEGIESLAEIDLPGAPGSFGPGKYAATSEFWLYEPNPDYEGFGGNQPASLPVSEESFRVEGT